MMTESMASTQHGGASNIYVEVKTKDGGLQLLTTTNQSLIYGTDLACGNIPLLSLYFPSKAVSSQRLSELHTCLVYLPGIRHAL